MNLPCITSEHRSFLCAIFACLVALFFPSPGPCQQSAADQRTGFLPPLIVLFEDENGNLASNDAGSAAAESAVSEAFGEAMEDRQVQLVNITRDAAGPVNRSPLMNLPAAISSTQGPVAEEALPLPYQSEILSRVMGADQLDRAWIVTGVQIPHSRVGNEQEGGTRTLLRAALVDRKGMVVFSDIYDSARGAAVPARGEQPPGAGDLRDRQTADRIIRSVLAEYRTDKEAVVAAVRASEEKLVEEHMPIAAELRIGVGVYIFVEDGADFSVSFRPAESHWQFGYRYFRWTDVFEDPFTGRQLTKTTYTLQGLQVDYQFTPEKNDTWYLGASLLRYTSNEVFLPTGASDSDSTFAPFLGGGYTGHLGKNIYYNLGMLLAPWAESKTDTGESSEESSGLFDIQVQMGVAF
jgi:hypothetical protein